MTFELNTLQNYRGSKGVERGTCKKPFSGPRPPPGATSLQLSGRRPATAKRTQRSGNAHSGKNRDGRRRRPGDVEKTFPRFAVAAAERFHGQMLLWTSGERFRSIKSAGHVPKSGAGERIVRLFSWWRRLRWQILLQQVKEEFDLFQGSLLARDFINKLLPQFCVAIQLRQGKAYEPVHRVSPSDVIFSHC